MSNGHTTRMSLCVLGSGSTGNCSVLVCESSAGDRTITLIDLGLSPRETRRRLDHVGIDLAEVSQALLTHFDSDHFRPTWSTAANRLGLTLRFARHHRGWAQRSGALDVRSEPFNVNDTFELTHGVCVNSVRLAHDSLGTVGYRIAANGATLGFATDLGRVPRPLLDSFVDLDLLAIESNYCPQMQQDSPRPMFLKKRIMGGKGHLSNYESLAAAVEMAGNSPRLTHIVKLHLSQQCNDPQLIQELYAARAPHLADKLTLTSAYHPTPWIHIQFPPIVNSQKSTASRAVPGTGNSQPTPAVQHTFW